jgi:hypothetical protein
VIVQRGNVTTDLMGEQHAARRDIEQNTKCDSVLTGVVAQVADLVVATASVAAASFAQIDLGSWVALVSHVRKTYAGVGNAPPHCSYMPPSLHPRLSGHLHLSPSGTLFVSHTDVPSRSLDFSFFGIAYHNCTSW